MPAGVWIQNEPAPASLQITTTTHPIKQFLMYVYLLEIRLVQMEWHRINKSGKLVYSLLVRLKHSGHFHESGLTSIPSRISNYILYKV